MPHNLSTRLPVVFALLLVPVHVVLSIIAARLDVSTQSVTVDIIFSIIHT